MRSCVQNSYDAVIPEYCPLQGSGSGRCCHSWLANAGSFLVSLLQIEISSISGLFAEAEIKSLQQGSGSEGTREIISMVSYLWPSLYIY